MSLFDDVVDVLHDLEYPKCEAVGNLEKIDLITFSEIVNWLTCELQVLLNTESYVNPIADENDEKSLRLELNSVLREMNSPFSDKSLSENNGRLAIVNYLCGELLAARILHSNQNPDLLQTFGSIKIEMAETQTASDLKAIITGIGLGKPPPNITEESLFIKLEEKIKEKLEKNSMKIEDPLLLSGGLTLSHSQWQYLEDLEKQLEADYTIRRQTLITRCECTINSFKWRKDSKPEINDKLNKIIQEIKQLPSKPNIGLHHALAVKASDCEESLNSIVSSSHQSCDIVVPMTLQANRGKQQRLSLHKFVIGYVPDRGGRPTEQAPPAIETFDQQQRQRHQPQSERGGRGRGRGSQSSFQGYQQQNFREPNYNRVQGAGWNQSGDQWNTDNKNRSETQYRGHSEAYQRSYQGQNSGNYHGSNAGYGQQYNNHQPQSHGSSYQQNHRGYGDSTYSGGGQYKDSQGYGNSQTYYPTGQYPSRGQRDRDRGGYRRNSDRRGGGRY